MGGGPAYIPDRKLGKGGFGQVWLGRRVNAKKGVKEMDAASSLVGLTPLHECVFGSKLNERCAVQSYERLRMFPFPLTEPSCS